MQGRVVNEAVRDRVEEGGNFTRMPFLLGACMLRDLRRFGFE